MSSDLQSKLGEGFSRVQEGIEQGKQKLQIAQEISRLKRAVADNSHKKTTTLYDLGQLAYRKIRDGQILDEELLELTGSIAGLDKNMYTAHKEITRLSSTTVSVVTCLCGTINETTDKFCGGCGTRLETPVELDLSKATPCFLCEELLSPQANFCHCCGSRA